MGKTLTTISEVVFISIVEDAELSREVKRTKISKQLGKVAEGSESFGIDLEKRLHGRVVKQAVSQLVTPC